MKGDKVRLLRPKKGYEESCEQLILQEKESFPIIATISYEEELLVLVQIRTKYLYNLDFFEWEEIDVG